MHQIDHAATREATAILRRAKQRATPQRVAVLASLVAQGDHVTAEEIYRRVAPDLPAITLSTVYRTLERLRDLRIVSETDLGGGARHFELVEEEPHHHLICTECGAMIVLDDEAVIPLRERIVDAYEFAPEIDHLAIFGRCAGCRPATVKPVRD